jgi:hypothetical protein
VKSATELAAEIIDSRLRSAFLEEIKNVREMFNEQGRVFPPRSISHARK